FGRWPTLRTSSSASGCSPKRSPSRVSVCVSPRPSTLIHVTPVGTDTASASSMVTSRRVVAPSRLYARTEMRAGVGVPATISVPGGVPGFTRVPRCRRVPSAALRRRVRQTSSGIEPCSGTVRWLSSKRVIESRRMSSFERRVAVDAARAAGRLLREELSGARHIAYKDAPTNLVTEMDRRAEAEILDRLRAAFPDDAILSEEAGAASGRSGRRWIVDPLDGTTNYAHGLPVFG